MTVTEQKFSQNARVHEASVCSSYDGDWVSIIAMLVKNIFLLSAEIVFWWFILSLKLYHTRRPLVVPPHLMIQKWPRIIKNISFWTFLNPIWTLLYFLTEKIFENHQLQSLLQSCDCNRRSWSDNFWFYVL